MDAVEQVLNILVDFDNVDPLARKKGVDPILHSALDAAAKVLGKAMPRRVTIRLYGGWYDGLSPTRKAQDLVRSRYFISPIPRCPTGFPSTDAVCVKAELARTLLSCAGNREPANFTHTFRTRPVSTIGFRTRFPDHSRCDAQPCFLTDLGNFFKTGECPVSCNHQNIAACVLRDEQKLVDVMLATDLLYLAQAPNVSVAVLVSSDDDLWPAILQATLGLQKLVHVHTNEDGERKQYEKLVDWQHYVKINLA